MRSPYSGWQGHFSSKVLLLTELFLSFTFAGKSKEASWKAVYSSADQLLHHVMIMNRHNKQMDRSYTKISTQLGSVGAWDLIIRSYIYFVVQFYSWFKFFFPLFQTYYHTLPYPKTKENKISTKDKIEPQLIQLLWLLHKINLEEA